MRVTQQIDLFLSKLLAERIDDNKKIGEVLTGSDRRRVYTRYEGLASRPLIPVDDHEFSFQGALKAVRKEHCRHSWAAVNK